MTLKYKDKKLNATGKPPASCLLGIDIGGAGIGVPGPVMRDKAGSYIVNRCVNLNWGIKNVDEEFRALTGIRDICVLNDANAATFGELKAAGNETGNAVLITIGTGIGGGTIIDGTARPGRAPHPAGRNRPRPSSMRRRPVTHRRWKSRTFSLRFWAERSPRWQSQWIRHTLS